MGAALCCLGKERDKRMTLSEKIKSLRRSGGMTQEQLAERIGVTRQALSKWETGDAVPDTENVIQLARLFSVTTDSLLLDDPPPASPAPAAPRPALVLPIIGWCLCLLSALGLLTLGILSSVFPVHMSVATVGDLYSEVAYDGISAFLRYHHLLWLAVLLVFALLAGVAALMYHRFPHKRRGDHS